MRNCFKHIYALTTFKIFFKLVFFLFHPFLCSTAFHQNSAIISTSLGYTSFTPKMMIQSWQKNSLCMWEVSEKNNPCEGLAKVWDFATNTNAANVLLFLWYYLFPRHTFIVKNGGAQDKNVILFAPHYITENQALDQQRMPTCLCVVLLVLVTGGEQRKKDEVLKFFFLPLVFHKQRGQNMRN